MVSTRMIEWSLVDKFPIGSSVIIFSGRLLKTKSRVLPWMCVGNPTSCTKVFFFGVLKKILLFLSYVSWSQSIAGKLKSPINSEFGPAPSISLNNSCVFSSDALGGLYTRVIWRLFSLLSLLSNSNWAYWLKEQILSTLLMTRPFFT